MITWNMVIWGVAAAVVLLLIVGLAVFARRILAGLFRFRIEQLRRQSLREAKEALSELTRALWSDTLGERLAALSAMQQLARRRGEGVILADVLSSFIRARLGDRARWGGDAAGFNDVRFALDLLTSRVIRLPYEKRGYFIDLSNLDFRGVPLRGADLHRLNLSGSTFEGCDLWHTILRMSVLRGAHLKGASLVRAMVQQADFTGACLSEANLQRVTAQQADFTDAVMTGATLSKSSFSAAQMQRVNLIDAELVNVTLSYANLTGAKLLRVDFSGSRLIRTDLSGADLTNADLTDTRIGHAVLADAEVAGALLADARGLSQRQLDSAIGDTSTTVPERLKFIPMKTRPRKPALEIVKSA